MKQISFATLAESVKKRKTKRERFLEEMEAVIPWAALVTLVDPHYLKAGKGRRPGGLETMLRVYFMQQWFNLSDPGMDDALYDVPCRIRLCPDKSPCLSRLVQRFSCNLAPCRYAQGTVFPGDRK